MRRKQWPSIAALVMVGCGGRASPGALDPAGTSPAVEQDGPAQTVAPAEAAPMAIAAAPGEDGVWDVGPEEPLQPPTLVERPESDSPDERMLPEDFKVYVRGTTVINHPAAGMEERVLPTVNDFKGRPGCYVACYTHDGRSAVYPVGGNTWVRGQMRVPGSYDGRICKPLRFERADISRAEVFKEMCRMSIPSCGHNCWAGGDTGGWFGR